MTALFLTVNIGKQKHFEIIESVFNMIEMNFYEMLFESFRKIFAEICFCWETDTDGG